jgi:hypothetical protein
MDGDTTLRQVSTLPHRESGGFLYSSFLGRLAYRLRVE